MQISRSQPSVRLALLLTTICAVFLVIGGSADAETPQPPPTVYVVEAGDTLWEIAATHAPPGADVRRLIHDIAQTNRVDDGLIIPGQVLSIPTT